MFDKIIDLISNGVSKTVNGLSHVVSKAADYRPRYISRLNQLIYKITNRPPWYKYYGDNNEIDYPDLSIYELVEKTSLTYPHNFAYEYYGKKVTYKEFIIKIKKTASALVELGIKPGDRVTICMPNTPVAIITFYALNMIGATACMIHPLSSKNEIEFYLNEANSKYILTIDLVYDKIMDVVENTKLKKIIVSSISDDMSKFKYALYWFFSGRKNKIVKNEKAIFYRELLELGAYDKDFKGVKRSKDDEAVILYSGGTTGSPKGIVLTNLCFNALVMQLQLAVADVAKPSDSVLAVLPIFHGFGLAVSIHTPLYIGAKVILVPDFSPRKFGSLIKKYNPSYIIGVPTLYEALLKTKLGRFGLSHLTCAICGGDTLTPEFKKEVDDFLEKHGSKAKVRCGYGLTESTGACALNPSKEYRDNSVGIPLPSMNFKIIKIGSTEEADFMEDGEICISGPTVMKEYLNNPEETKKVLILHADGKYWLHTGDVGCMDSDGFVYFKQRLKRMIVSSGYNIYPSYVEEIISENEYVDTCCVVGIPHEYKKQAVKVYIVLKDGIKPTGNIKREIKKYCEDNLVRYSWPYEYEYRDSLPKTLVGKVAYRELQDEEKKKNGN